jgi:hypothetical protein
VVVVRRAPISPRSESDLEVIQAQLSRLPTRRELSGDRSWGIIWATMMLTTLSFALKSAAVRGKRH